MYKAVPPALSIAAISSPPKYCQSVNILARYCFISQLASILLCYWSPVSLAEFTVATPPSLLMLLSLLLTFSILTFPLSLVCDHSHSLSFSLIFLLPCRETLSLLNKLPYVISLTSVVFVGSLTSTVPHFFYT